MDAIAAHDEICGCACAVLEKHARYFTIFLQCSACSRVTGVFILTSDFLHIFFVSNVAGPRSFTAFSNTPDFCWLLDPSLLRQVGVPAT